MKRCPECRRDYYDDTLLYCLDDGNALLEGPATASGGDEPATAILADDLSGEAATREQIEITDQTAVLPTVAGDVAQTARSFDKRLLAVPFLLGIIVLGGLFGYRYFSPARQIESIAVIPFVNESGNADVEYLSDGMTETLINTLTQLPNLRVKPRSSAFRYKGREFDTKVIGKEMNVGAILNGRLVQRGEDITLFLSLIDTATEDQIWGKQYSRKLSNLVSLQAEVGRDVSETLRLKLTGTDSSPIIRNDTTNPEAYRLYLQGRYFWNKRRIGDTGKAIGYFQQAIDLDPNYARAYAGLADAVAQPSDVIPHSQRKGRARVAALKALSLNDDLAEGHTALAFIMLRYELNFEAARGELERAYRLDPNWTDTYQRYGELLYATGQFDEAFAKYQQGLAIEPFNLPLNTSYGGALVNARRYDEGIAQLKKATDIDPDHRNAHVLLAIAYSLRGMYSEAVEHRVTALKLAGQDDWANSVRAAFSKGGWPAVARAELERFQTIDRSQSSDRWPFYNEAAWFSQLGEKDKAFASLIRSIETQEQPWLIFLKVDPRFESLRDDPRFNNLLDKLGFPR